MTEDIFPSKPRKKGGAPQGNRNAKKKEPRNRDINLKVTAKEFRRFTRQAKRYGMSRNAWILQKLDK